MTLVVVGSRADHVLAPEAFEELLRGRDRLVVDMGSGDGRGAYALARRRPDALVVGIDPAADNLRATAARAARKPARGGLANLLLLRGAAEEPAPELVGRAYEIQVTLPWGALLVGLVEGAAPILEGLAALAADGASCTVTLNCEIWSENTPADLVSLVEADPAQMWAQSERYLAAGLRIDEVRYLDGAELVELPSTWARRLLSSRAGARFLLVRCTRLPRWDDGTDRLDVLPPA